MCVHTCARVHMHTYALTSTHSSHADTQCIYRHSHTHTHSLTPSLALPCQYLFLSGIIFLDVFFVVLPANHPRSQDPGIFSQDVEIPDIFAQRNKSNCTLGLMETVSCKSAIDFTLPPPCQKKQREGSGFFKAFSLPGTGHSLLTLSATLRDPDYIFHVSDEEIKAQRTW